MNSLNDKSIQSKFNDLKTAINEGRSKWPISQGANALIVVYPPEQEEQYLDRVYRDYCNEYFINLSNIFINAIDKYGVEPFKTNLRNYRSTPQRLFYDKENKKSLYMLIINEIKNAFEQDKIPIIIRAGILYGTHIENTNIVENKIVQRSPKPLILFYPATVEEGINEKSESIRFLGIKKASDYRGYII